VVFGTMFGGERFQDWIGTISIGQSAGFWFIGKTCADGE
jgi:hypothetical protein